MYIQITQCFNDLIYHILGLPIDFIDLFQYGEILQKTTYEKLIVYLSKFLSFWKKNLITFYIDIYYD